MGRPATRRPARLSADTDMDAAVPEIRPAVRRGVGRHCRAHADAASHSVRVPSRTGSPRKYRERSITILLGRCRFQLFF